MARPVDPRGEYVEEIAWAIVVIDVIIALCALFLAPHVGAGTAVLLSWASRPWSRSSSAGSCW